MQYMLLIYGKEERWASLSEDEAQAVYAEYGRLSQELRDRNAYVDGGELQPVSTATSVRIRDGETDVTDGPFAETKEVLGGYYLIEAESLDEAIAWAAKIPSARTGVVEVRPVVMREAEVSA
jgi:hypothetical protein